MRTKIVCTTQPSLIRGYFAGDKGDQIFVICKQGGEYVMQKKVKQRRKFLAWVDMEFIQYLDESEESMRIPIFNSNKTQIGVLAAWGIPLVGYLVHRLAPDVSNQGIHVGMICAAAIVCSHIIGYSITDGLVHFGKGEKK